MERIEPFEQPLEAILAPACFSRRTDLLSFRDKQIVAPSPAVHLLRRHVHGRQNVPPYPVEGDMDVDAHVTAEVDQERRVPPLVVLPGRQERQKLRRRRADRDDALQAAT